MKHIPTIIIRVVDHKAQRYDTAGDYYQEGNAWHITISKMGFWYELFVAIHELYEMCVCIHRGIEEPDIAKFDKDHIEHPDPGTIPSAPYHKEHMAATEIERTAVKVSGKKWDVYDKSFAKLKWRKE